MIKEIVGQLTNKELQKAFGELKDWVRTGVLEDGYVRAVHQTCEEKLDSDVNLRSVETQILYEIGERFSFVSFEE